MSLIARRSPRAASPDRRIFGLVVASLLASAAPPAHAGDDCLPCHRGKAGKSAPVDLSVLGRSVHAGVGCTSCHTSLAGVPEGKKHVRAGPASCAGCHENAAHALAGSVHGRNKGRGVGCPSCHGGHDVLPRSNPASPITRQAAPRLCSRCHDGREGGPADRYLIGAHGIRLVGKGLLVAASCVDCHGSHAIGPRAQLDAHRVIEACGTCHRGPLESWKASPHGRRRGQPEASCLDCHRAHLTLTTSSRGWREESAARCGGCHQQQRASFRRTFHGKAHALKQTAVASCPDCHGSHRVSAARVTGGARTQLCRKCHARATASFATYLSHPDHRDRGRYPSLYWTHVLMLALIIAVFAFFTVHSVVWLIRSVVFRLARPEAFRAERKRAAPHHDAGKVYMRFRPVDRYTHLMMMSAFLLLVLSGMPLRYHDAGWARAMVGALGGVEILRMLHRLGAILSVVCVGMHIWGLSVALRRHRPRFTDHHGKFHLRSFLRFAFGPDSPMPNRQDFRDFWAHQKWFFGRGPRPQFDRWTYWEKFDYLAVFWGMAMIGPSGLMLCFPQLAARIFPGWTLNVAAIAHSAEALLAAGFVVAFHLFNVHLRLDKFPLDSSIFTGRITEEEMLTARRRLYDRLLAEGRLAEERRRANVSHTPILWFAVVVVAMLAVFWGLATRFGG